MSVGGKVVDVVHVSSSKLWVSTNDAPPWRTPNIVAVYVDPAGHAIHIGDSLWWQSGIAYWTPKDRPYGAFDIPLRKIGCSGVPRPQDEPR